MSFGKWLPLILGLVLSGCSARHAAIEGANLSSQSQEATAAQLQAFETTVYAFGQTQGCISCHNSFVNPQWMSSDLRTAYNFAKPLLNMADPGNSIFSVYVANGHCGQAICQDQNNVATMQDLLLQWAAVEINETGGTPSGGSTLPNPPFVTATLAIPSPLPVITTKTPAVIRFDLSQVTPAVAGLNGTLEISIASYNAAGTTYKIFNPRIFGNSNPISISGMHIYVRPATGTGLGTEDINQGTLWSQLALTAPVVASPSPLPTGPASTVSPLTSISLGVGQQSTADVITIGFANIH
jgi:hypothetical protein